MSATGRGPEIRPLAIPPGPTRLALIQAYRRGLRSSPAQAWEDALALACDRFPGVGQPSLRKMVLLSLGLFGADGREGPYVDVPPDMEGCMPCLVRPEIGLRLPAAADHFGLTVDDLVSRVLDAWMTAACDFDGIPEDRIPVPPAGAFGS